MLNDISTSHTVGLYWVRGHTGVQGNEKAEKLTRDGSVQKFVGRKPSLGASRQNIRKKKQCEVLAVLREGSRIDSGH